MSMNLSAQLEQKLETTLAMKQMMAHSLVESVRETIAQLRSGALGDTSGLLGVVIRTALLQAKEQIRDPHVQAALESYFGDPQNISYMASKTDAIAQATISGFDPFVRQALIEGLPNEGDGKYALTPGHQEMKTTFASLDRALKDPNKLQTELEEKTKSARKLRKNIGTGFISEISEGRTALQMAEVLAPHLKVAQQLFTIAFRVQGADGEPILPRFFREAAVMKDLDWEISDRISRRFVTRFASARSNAPAYEFSDAMINTIGEFTLVSLGVLDPTLFRRARGNVQEIDVLFADQLDDDATDGARSMAASLSKYNLAERGPIYWCRWALPDGVQLTRMTDELVRDFMRITVAKDTREVLDAFKFDAFFEKIKDLRRQASGDKAERAAHYAEALSEALTQPEFRNFLIERCSTQWFLQLQRLLQMKS